MSTANPAISVVVNTTDRAHALDTLLRSLHHQSYRNFEVVAVVGPTRDHTLDVLAGYDGRDAPPISADLGPVLDAQAKRAYRRRLLEGFPVCGLAVIDFETPLAGIAQSSGRLRAFLKPGDI